MKTFYNLRNFLKKKKPPRDQFAATIGVFDGLHKAHEKVIKTLVKKAEKKHLLSLVITFDPHPANVVRIKKTPLLISLKHRLYLLREMGVDYAIVVNFNRSFSRMRASEFIKNIFNKIRIKEMVIGENFFFGKDRGGSLELLRKFSKLYGYKVTVKRNIKSSGKVVSSTWIRNLILEGNLKKAEGLLSRPVSLLGTVIKGHKRGRIIGFPTANIDPHHEAAPPPGVYAVRVKLNSKEYKGILNIGFRPTFSEANRITKDPSIEVHIFDFNKSIYGNDLEISFVKKIRTERKFDSVKALRQRIIRDAKKAKLILKSA